MKKRISIIGANGYIGRHLVHFLNKKDYEIYAYDVHESIHHSLPASIFYKQSDITLKEDCTQIEYNVDYILIFAGITGTYNGFEEYERFVKVNELGLLHLLNEIKLKKNKPHIIFPSTRLVYKGEELPLEEEAEKEAKTVYAVNKIAAELYIKSYSNSFDIPYTIFRICVPYGNVLDNNFSYGTIGFFVNKAKNKDNIVLFGDGSLERTFTSIDYLCAQIIDVIGNKKVVNDVYNIHGERFSLREVAEMFAEKFSINIEYVDWPKNHLLIESGSTVFNSDKILDLIDSKPVVNLSSWISDLNV